MTVFILSMDVLVWAYFLKYYYQLPSFCTLPLSFFLISKSKRDHNAVNKTCQLFFFYKTIRRDWTVKSLAHVELLSVLKVWKQCGVLRTGTEPLRPQLSVNALHVCAGDCFRCSFFIIYGYCFISLLNLKLTLSDTCWDSRRAFSTLEIEYLFLLLIVKCDTVLTPSYVTVTYHLPYGPRH